MHQLTRAAADIRAADMLRLLRLPGALSPTLSAGTSRACSSRCSVYEARHRIFGASLSRDPRPYKSLKNLQHAGGFIGPKVAAYYPKPHPLMRHPVFRMVRAAIAAAVAAAAAAAAAATRARPPRQPVSPHACADAELRAAAASGAQRGAAKQDRDQPENGEGAAQEGRGEALKEEEVTELVHSRVHCAEVCVFDCSNFK